MATSMDGIESEKAANRKRQIDWTETISLDGNESDNEMPAEKTVLNEMSMKISFVDPDLNFLIVDWSKCCEYLDTTTKHWDFLAFSSDHKNVLITTNTKEDNAKMLKLKEIVVNGKKHAIKFDLLKTSKKKGIAFNKILMTMDEEKLKESLNLQSIFTYFRIQKTNNVTNEKSFTGSIILEFDNEVCQSVTISKVKIPVNQMIPKIMICYHCGLLGHTNKRCNKIHLQICPKCYNQHEPGYQCRVSCKQCKGNHKSTDATCEILIKEMQILKLKEKYAINYFDAKNIASSSEPAKTMDPLDQARINIQELKYKNEIMYNQARKIIEENNQLKNIVKIKDRDIEELKETAKREKAEFIEELNEMTESFKKHQEEFQKIVEVSGNLSKKYESAVDQIEKLKKTKLSDMKFVENFINSNDAIVKEGVYHF